VLQPLVFHLQLKECVQHRRVPAWVRLGGSEETLAGVVALYKVGVPDDFEQHLRCPWRGFRGTGRGCWRRNFGFRVHPDIGLHIRVIPDGLLKKFLEVLAIVDVHYVEESSVNEVLVPPSKEFLDGCATIKDLTLSGENEDDRFGQFGDKQVSPTLPLSELKGR